jgi:serine phosphatase RsbU (regulator of sigma subunit)/ABC-type phosphate/phosphonate transport system substrate-binding protein
VVALLLVATISGGAAAGDQRLGPTRIGVLANRGRAACRTNWLPTVEYLNSQLRGRQFELVPLDFDEVEPAVRNRQVDFLVANPAIYVEMEAKYGVARIATMETLVLGQPCSQMGTVVFTRATEPAIHTLADLNGRRLLAVDRTSLGGWLIAWGELKRAGIKSERDLAGLSFTNSHDGVVMAVLQGKVDAGSIRTDTLERMQAEGKISLKDVRVLPPLAGSFRREAFPYECSSRLFPEWPMAMLANTPEALAKQVAAALLALPPEHQAARAAKIAGWTIPLSYQPVHDLMRELRIGPYKDLGRVTLGDIVRQYGWSILGALAGVVVLAAFSVYVARLNGQLQASQARIAESLHQLEIANGQVMESIHYARTIQQALLPSARQMQAAPWDHFVIWAPRDIIGGDLFWADGREGEFIVALVDCTGHGVPGAIMTMLAGSTLHRVISTCGSRDPAQILAEMNRIIRHTLSREAASRLTDDGLDMAICHINQEQRVLTFAGAKLSLFEVQGGTVTEVAGDPESIGYQSSDESYRFQNHRVPLAAGQTFYLTTDGMLGQVGSDRQIPFGKSRLRRFLAEHHDQPIARQRQLLEALMAEHRGHEAQRDDITVLGFRFPFATSAAQSVSTLPPTPPSPC